MRTLQGCRVLVVEDDYVIATDLAEMLRSAGAHPVGPLGWADAALALASAPASALDLAIMDVDLHGGPSYVIADALTARHVPVIFTTGFGSEALAAAYRGYMRLEKPVSETALMQALRNVWQVQDAR